MIEIEYVLTVQDTPKEENSLHWYAFNYRNASTENANEMFLALENYVNEQVKKRTCDELGVCQKINCEVCL
jgi:hypothetical protein